MCYPLHITTSFDSIHLHDLLWKKITLHRADLVEHPTAGDARHWLYELECVGYYMTNVVIKELNYVFRIQKQLHRRDLCIWFAYRWDIRLTIREKTRNSNIKCPSYSLWMIMIRLWFSTVLAFCHFRMALHLSTSLKSDVSRLTNCIIEDDIQTGELYKFWWAAGFDANSK